MAQLQKERQLRQGHGQTLMQGTGGLSNFAWAREPTPLTAEEEAIQSLVRGFAFPLNPEERWLTEQDCLDCGPNSNCPLLAANPAASLVQDVQPSQLAQEWALPPLDLQRVWQEPPPPVTTDRFDRAWFAKDLTMLLNWVMRPSNEELGAKLLRYLPTWKATCGGDAFIAIGMLPYWDDPLKA
jgi:hypothetical protein